MEDSAITELYAINIEDTLSGKKLFMLKKRTVVSYCTLPHTVVRNRSSKWVICKENKLRYRTVTTVTHKKLKMFLFNSIWRQLTIISGVLWNLRPLVLNKIYLTQTHKTVYFVKTVHAKSFHNYIWTGI